MNLFPAWQPRLSELCDKIRGAARESVRSALLNDGREASFRPVREGASDWTYELDLRAEDALEAWLSDVASREPVSVLTEDRGWLHRGPAASASTRRDVELDSFDHGGPRIAVDPVDGTRNLMADLRSGWTVVSFACPGPGAPRLGDLSAGIVAEIPTSTGGSYRTLWAERGKTARLEVRELAVHMSASLRERREGEPASFVRALTADSSDRPDHGYFPFFKYCAELRPAIASIERAFFERLERLEKAEIRSCYDDQYISSGGQLFLLALGTYRMVADLRAWLAARNGRSTITSKPYDLAGAVVCARAAGCIVLGPDFEELDCPIDGKTPVSMIGFANEATRRRLEPHLREALRVVL